MPAPVSARLHRIDRAMHPVVMALLVLGALFLVTAWSVAEDAVGVAQKKDEIRAARLADSVDQVVSQHEMALAKWASENGALLVPARRKELGAELTNRAGPDSGPDTVAWIVVRRDGTPAGIGETEPGRLFSSGIEDDLSTLGRRAITQDKPLESGRLTIDDRVVYATAVPIDSPSSAGAGEGASAAGPHFAVISLIDLQESALGAFLGSTGRSERVDSVTLVDTRGRVLLGRTAANDLRARVRRGVGSTGWSIEYSREEISALLPIWSYPAFAALLVVVASGYAFQTRRQAQLRRVRDQRTAQVQQLYHLAERMLHADDIEGQALDLARSMQELIGASGVRVTVTSVGSTVERSVGDATDGAEAARFEIAGPRAPLGELVVTRRDKSLEHDDELIAQTAVTLAGAAMHTLVALETERAAAAELQRLDELRSNLLTTVAHELLSPLTAVKGVLGLLSMRTDLGERNLEYVEVATERTDRLVALIRDLFDCSLLETGQLDIRPRRQRADALLEAALGAQAAARPGELRLSATPNLMITVDPIRFDQFVNNLVTNALRHGAPPVEVAVRPGDGGAYVVVTDEGPGIPADQRSDIFDKFWQASSGHARASEGAGLGLNLVQGLVRVHGGEITVDSTHPDGRGARFTAFFPDEIPGLEIATAAAEARGAF